MNIVKTRTEQVIDVGDWDQLVIDTYGKPYCFQQQDGCKERQRVSITIPDQADDYENDSVPEIVNYEQVRGVSFQAWLARDPEQKIPPKNPDFGNDFTWLWWDRNFYPDVQMIANDLHSKGLIEAGTYTIDIDW